MSSVARRSKPFLILWLCLLSFLDVKALPDMVLCLGQDGHVELESAVEDRCGNIGNAADYGFAALSQSPEDHCGECSDISLAGMEDFPSRARMAFTATGIFPVAIAATTPRIPYSVLGVVRIRPFEPSSIPQVLASIRSVRLLV